MNKKDIVDVILDECKVNEDNEARFTHHRANFVSALFNGDTEEEEKQRAICHDSIDGQLDHIKTIVLAVKNEIERPD